MNNNIVQEFENKHIAILGFGREGKSTYNFIKKHLTNYSITIIDKNDKIKEEPLIKNETTINVITGDNYLNNLEKYDIIMKTPGISFKEIDISSFKDKINSQLQILLKYYKNNIIGITGTKGKSTTSSLIYNILKQNNKKTFLLGNIGTPIFDHIDEIEKDTTIVVEMSSHQLEFITSSPHIAVITNFYQDHLDHTNGLQDYYNCKLNITKYQTEKDYIIYYKGSKALTENIKSFNKAKVLTVDFENTADIYSDKEYIYKDNNIIYNCNDKRNLIGEHNLINIMLSLTVSNILSLDKTKTNIAINTFKPLEHRLENVGTYNNITYYNDSIATIPDATINGINALKNVNTLIFGGLDRGIDYNEFINYLLKCNIENLICMPTTGHTIATELIKRKSTKNIYLVNSLNEAVQKAKLVTKENTICLMSPAAASYEQFKNFEEKGNKYKELIRNN